MIIKKITIFAILILTVITFAGEKYAGQKLIAYVPTWCSGLPTYDNKQSIDKIDFSKLTHAIVAFINSDEDGNLIPPEWTASPWTHEEAIDTIIARAKRADAKVLLSLGSDINGWNMTLNPQARTNFVKNIKQYMTEKNIDGLDLDLEGGWAESGSKTDPSAPFYSDEYELLAKELRDSLGSEFYLTAAIGASPKSWNNEILWTDGFLEVLDWVNIMVYDLHMWNAQDIQNHSGFDDQITAAQDWENRGLSKEKLVFGVPFYANGWDSDNKKRYEIEINWYHEPDNTDSSTWVWNKTPLTTNYFVLDSLFDLAADADSVIVTQADKIWLDAENSGMGYRTTHNGKIYFNGQETLKKKAKWAIDKGYGGIMIWEATGDLPTENPRSLLAALAAQFEESTDESTDDIEKLRKELADSIKIIDKLRKDIETFNKNYKSLNDEYDALQDDLDELLKQLEECRGLTPVSKIIRSDDKYGIRFTQNIVSDKAEISVILPNSEKVSEAKIIVYDATGNIVFETAAENEVIIWNLQNNSGRDIANGSYLVIAEVKSGKGMIYCYSAKLGVKK